MKGRKQERKNNLMEHSILIIIVCAFTTAFTRFLPFLVFGKNKKAPDYISYLGRVLPCAIMATLVVYCLKNINFLIGNHSLPELISVILVILLHVWKKNTLFSISGGTLCYMVLIQMVFVS